MSPYLETTPVLSLAERREKIEAALARLDELADDRCACLTCVMMRRDARQRLRAQLANLSEE